VTWAAQANHETQPYLRCHHWDVSVLLVTHESSLDHDSGHGHPERPERLAAVIAGIRSSGCDVIEIEAPLVEFGDLTVVHDAEYVDAIERFCASGGGYLDADTHVGPGSWVAALRSAGAGLAAVQALEQGSADAAFVATRPPGHHALAGHAMGFCVFNNIAVVAASLTSLGDRVAIVDWDVHHGNGTQDMFYDDPEVLYLSLHESPMYPGTGRLGERGTAGGVGKTLNMPLPAGTTGAVYRWLIDTVVLPSLGEFEPDWLLVSAGYDAHRSDPLARILLESDDYGAMAGSLRSAVEGGRTVFFLEGGYDLEALEASAAATLRGHSGLLEPRLSIGKPSNGLGWDEALRAAEVLASKPG
jgi:acetoin utilization deacetylase AcuC-like enzyme